MAAVLGIRRLRVGAVRAMVGPTVPTGGGGGICQESSLVCQTPLCGVHCTALRASMPLPIISGGVSGGDMDSGGEWKAGAEGVYCLGCMAPKLAIRSCMSAVGVVRSDAKFIGGV